MFFISLKLITDVDKQLIKKLDSLLLHFYKKDMYFTHITVSQALSISEETSYQLLLSAENAGVIGIIEVKKCNDCGAILYKKDTYCKCLKENFKEGYLYTTIGI